MVPYLNVTWEAGFLNQEPCTFLIPQIKRNHCLQISSLQRLKRKKKGGEVLGVVAHTWNPSTLEPEAGALLQVRPDRATQLNSAQIEKKKVNSL